MNEMWPIQPKNESRGSAELTRCGYEAQCPHIEAMRRDAVSHDLWAGKITQMGASLVVLHCDNCAVKFDPLAEWRVRFQLVTQEAPMSLLRNPSAGAWRRKVGAQCPTS